MNARLVRVVDGKMVEAIVPLTIEFFEELGYKFRRPHYSNSTIRQIQGVPEFSGLAGPSWDGDVVRYEDWDAYDRLSR